MKNTQIVKLALSFAFVLVVSGSLFAQNNAKAPETRPDQIMMVKTDGSRELSGDIQGKSVFVLFQPDCDHCQREAQEIKKNIQAFKDYSVYFLSPAPMNEIAQFATDYQFEGEDNFYFAYIDLMDILNNFGGVQTPSLYIYAEDEQLVKAFNGETPIGKILMHI